MLAAAWTADMLLFHILLHLLICPAVNGTLDLDSVVSHIIFNQFICTKTLVTLFTVHQRICKSTQMTGCHPCLWIHKNGTIHTYVVRILLNELLPPCLLHIVFELNSKVSVIPCIGKSAIDFRTRIHKSSVLCKCYDFV